MLLTAAGQAFTVYRETTIQPGAETDAAAVLEFRFHLWFMPAPLVPFVVCLFEPLSILTTPFFAGFPGFRTKLWLFDHATGDYEGVYRWETAAAARRYARGLEAVMTRLSVPGTIAREVHEDAPLDAYVAERAGGPRSSPIDDVGRRCPVVASTRGSRPSIDGARTARSTLRSGYPDRGLTLFATSDSLRAARGGTQRRPASGRAERSTRARCSRARSSRSRSSRAVAQSASARYTSPIDRSSLAAAAAGASTSSGVAAP